MYAQMEKPKENKSRAVANAVAQKNSNMKQGFDFVDNRLKTVVQRKLQEMADNYSNKEQHPIQKKRSTSHPIQGVSNEGVMQMRKLREMDPELIGDVEMIMALSDCGNVWRALIMENTDFEVVIAKLVAWRQRKLEHWLGFVRDHHKNLEYAVTVGNLDNTDSVTIVLNTQDGKDDNAVDTLNMMLLLSLDQNMETALGVKPVSAQPGSRSTIGQLESLFYWIDEAESLPDLPILKTLKDKLLGLDDQSEKWQRESAHNELKDLHARFIATNDIAAVRNSLLPHIPEVTEDAVARVKKYNFMSSSITFTPENFLSWTRLATGKGKINDVRYLCHELHEVGVLDETTPQEAGYDYTEVYDDEEHGDSFGERYDVAHNAALRVECQFLADLLNQKHAGLGATYLEVAIADPTRGADLNYGEFGPVTEEAKEEVVTAARGTAEEKEIGVKLTALKNSPAVQLKSSIAQRHVDETQENTSKQSSGSIISNEELITSNVVQLKMNLDQNFRVNSSVLNTASSNCHAPIQRMAEFDLTDWKEQLISHPDVENFAELTPIGVRIANFDFLNPVEADVVFLRTAIVDLMNDRIYAVDDLDSVRQTLSIAMNTNCTREDILTLKHYNFDSDSILFTVENYIAWRRLAAGNAKNDDIRYFVQQYHEIIALRNTNISFDFAGHDNQEESFERWYPSAHHAAVVEEIRFLANAIAPSLGILPTWYQVARSDAERSEEFLVALAREEQFDISDPEVEPIDYAAIRAQFAADYSPTVRAALSLWKDSSATGNIKSKVWNYMHGLTPSTRAPSYWLQIGFVLVETLEGPVYCDIRNQDTVIAALGTFDVDQTPQSDWRDQMEDTRDAGDRPPIILADKAQIGAFNDSLNLEHSGINSDNIGGALGMAARELTLARKMATLVFTQVNNHTFLDGNKRTGELTLDWIVRQNRNGLGFTGDPKPFLSKAAQPGYSAHAFADDLDTIIPYPGVNEPK